MEEYYEEQISDEEYTLDEEEFGPEEEAETSDTITMGDLLEEVETPLISRLKRGQVVEGEIVQIDPGAILVDIGAKLDGFIHPTEVEQLQRDPAACPHVGDRVLVYVVQPANKDGHAVLSLARAQAERDWRAVQQQFENKELLELPVVGYNKGGLIVRLGEVRGFIPATQLDQRITTNNRPEERMKQLSKLVGRTLKLKIIELDRANNRLILSERLAMREWQEQERNRLLEDLREGEIRKGRVSGLSDFGAFVDIGGADGLVHLSELSWEQVSHPRQVLKVGDEVEVYVLNVDRERKRIALSIKRTRPEPWLNIHQRYQIGQMVKGRITKLASFGAFVRLEEGVEGLVHISELSSRRIQHPREVVQEGEEHEFRIIRIDSARRRMRLSLKQLEETPEAESELEDIPTPEVLVQGGRKRRRRAAPAEPEPPTAKEEEVLSEWQEQLREYQRTLPPASVEKPSPPAPAVAVAEPMDEVPAVAAPAVAVAEPMDEVPTVAAPAASPDVQVSGQADEILVPGATADA